MAQARIRPDVRTLSTPQQELLSKALQAMLDRKPDDPNSFASLASIHGAWFTESFPVHPDDKWCAHRSPTFPFWHRQYMLDFENALRSGGFDNVTLPYWDINQDTYGQIPAIFSKPPFNGSTYVGTLKVPTKFGQPARHTGDTTYRLDFPGNPTPEKREGFFNTATTTYDQIANQTITEALFFGWDGTGPRGSPTGVLEAGHNNVHNYTGGYTDDEKDFGDMADPTYAAFDPIFFFHHCNVDRLLEVWLNKQTETVREQVFMKWAAYPSFPKYGSISIDVLKNKGITYGESPVQPELSLMAVEPGAKAAGEPQQPKRALVIHLKNVKSRTTVISRRRGTTEVLAVSALFVSRNMEGCSNCIAKAGVDATFHFVDGNLKKEEIDCVVGSPDAAEVDDWEFVNLHE